MGSSTSCSKPHPSCQNDARVVSLPQQNANEHINQLINGLNTLRINVSLCDVTIHTGETDKGSKGVHHAHKCVLAASSGYFREKFAVSSSGFTDTPSKKLYVETLTNTDQLEEVIECPLKDAVTIEFPAEPAAMEAVLTYIYTGNLDSRLQYIQEIVEIAKRLDVPSLVQKCAVEIQNGFRLEYFQRVHRLASNLNIRELKEFSLRKVIGNFQQFVDTECFLNLSQDEVQEIANNRSGSLSSDCVIPELQFFNAILKWNKWNYKSRREASAHLLRCIHYNKIPQSTLSGYVIMKELVYKDKDLSGIIEDILGADRKRILQRLNTDGHTTMIGGVGDSAPRARHALVITGGRLFDQFTAQIQEFHEKEGIWREITRLPTTLAHHAVAAKDNLLYVAGGEESAIAGVRGLANLWCYDSIKNEWKTLADMQQGRSYFYLEIVDSHLYAIGGKSSNIIRTSVEKFCTTAKRWEFTVCLKQARYAHAGCRYKNNIFINGGLVRKSSTHDTIKFDTEANHWQSVAPMRCPRSRHCMASISDRIYVFGGETESLGVSQPASIAIECYTPQCDQWHKVAQKIDFQSDRECAYAAMRGYIYLVGGCRSNVTEHRHDVASYDPESDTWTTLPRLPRRLRGSACAVLTLS